MLVSIILSNYNYARYVGAAIESALAQTHPEVEVIVVDDGSTDGSGEAIARYAGRVEVLMQENRGQAAAMNAGYALSHGDPVIFLDADDELLPSAAAAAGDQGAAVIHWNIVEVDAQGTPTGTVHPGELAEGDLLPTLREDGPLQWPTPPTSGNAWTRRYLDAVMPVPEEEFRLNADAYLSSLAPLHGTLHAVAEPQTRYRSHGENNSHKPFDEMLHSIIDIRRLLAPITVAHARSVGVELDGTYWPVRGWDFRLARFLGELDAVVGRDTPFILVDGMELGLEQSERPVIPFLERDGEYWGAPEDDAQATRELDRLRDAGARYLVLAWPSFWWLEEYGAFFAHLRERHACLLENELLQVYDLR